MRETQIAAQLYTLRDYLQTPKDIARTLAKVRKIGYRIVQLSGLEILYSESDPRYLKAELDTCWVAFGGGDPTAWCLKYSGRLPLVHLKDMVATKENTQVYAEIGKGNLNWKSILSACKKAGTKLYIVEQDVCRRDPLESLKISLNNLHKMGLK